SETILKDTSTLNIVTGAPGSGKSHFAKKLKERLKELNPDIEVFALSVDDILNRPMRLSYNPEAVYILEGFWDLKRMPEIFNRAVRNAPSLETRTIGIYVPPQIALERIKNRPGRYSDKQARIQSHPIEYIQWYLGEDFTQYHMVVRNYVEEDKNASELKQIQDRLFDSAKRFIQKNINQKMPHIVFRDMLNRYTKNLDQAHLKSLYQYWSALQAETSAYDFNNSSNITLINASNGDEIELERMSEGSRDYNYAIKINGRYLKPMHGQRETGAQCNIGFNILEDDGGIMEVALMDFGGHQSKGIGLTVLNWLSHVAHTKGLKIRNYSTRNPAVLNLFSKISSFEMDRSIFLGKEKVYVGSPDEQANMVYYDGVGYVTSKNTAYFNINTNTNTVHYSSFKGIPKGTSLNRLNVSNNGIITLDGVAVARLLGFSQYDEVRIPASKPMPLTVDGALLSETSAQELLERTYGIKLKTIDGKLMFDPKDFTETSWTMNELRPKEEGPIHSAIESIPEAKLRFPVENLPAVTEYSMNAGGVYLGFIEGVEHPVIIKIFPEQRRSSVSSDLSEMVKAQIFDHLGVGPKFYGRVTLPDGKTGFAMQVVPVQSEAPFSDRRYIDIMKRVMRTGLYPSTPVITVTGNMVTIDAGNAEVDDISLYKSYLQQHQPGNVGQIGKAEIQQITVEGEIASVKYDEETESSKFPIVGEIITPMVSDILNIGEDSEALQFIKQYASNVRVLLVNGLPTPAMASQDGNVVLFDQSFWESLKQGNKYLQYNALVHEIGEAMGRKKITLAQNLLNSAEGNEAYQKALERNADWIGNNLLRKWHYYLRYYVQNQSANTRLTQRIRNHMANSRTQEIAYETKNTLIQTSKEQEKRHDQAKDKIKLEKYRAMRHALDHLENVRRQNDGVKLFEYEQTIIDVGIEKFRSTHDLHRSKLQVFGDEPPIIGNISYKNELRPIVQDINGIKWIGKSDEFIWPQFIREFLGARLHQALGFRSPEVRWAKINGEPYIFTEYIENAEPLKSDELLSLVPNTLPISMAIYNSNSVSHSDRNSGGYLKKNGAYYIFDFGGRIDKTFSDTMEDMILQGLLDPDKGIAFFNEGILMVEAFTQRNDFETWVRENLTELGLKGAELNEMVKDYVFYAKDINKTMQVLMMKAKEMKIILESLDKIRKPINMINKINPNIISIGEYVKLYTAAINWIKIYRFVRNRINAFDFISFKMRLDILMRHTNKQLADDLIRIAQFSNDTIYLEEVYAIILKTNPQFKYIDDLMRAGLINKQIQKNPMLSISNEAQKLSSPATSPEHSRST
ncbi:MAG: hypothetical protein Q8Q33_08460, partial [Chlamydiota bacterium]|nr:hypothetical protein [Chlamydiota bacterium]